LETRQAAPEDAECSAVALVEIAVVSIRLRFLLPLLALAALAGPSLATAATIKWTKHVRIEPAKDGGLTAVSCATSNFCVATDQSGQVLVSTKLSKGGGWSAPAKVDSAGPLTGISCASTSFCAAVDQVGALVYSTHPSGGAKAWSHPARIDSALAVGGGYSGLTDISCPSAKLCVAVDNGAKGNVVYSSDPTGGKAAWHSVALQGPVTSITCPSTSLCVAVGSERYVSTDPTSPTSWKASGALTGEVYEAVDCIGSTLCVSVGFGNSSPGIASASTSATGVWSEPVAVEGDPPLVGQGLIDTVGCTRGTCVALDGSDNAFISSKPALGIWGPGAGIRGPSLADSTAVSCTSGYCVVVDSAGVETTGVLK
jgi:hypothetical protein